MRLALFYQFIINWYQLEWWLLIIRMLARRSQVLRLEGKRVFACL